MSVLLSGSGCRKYFSPNERSIFLAVATTLPLDEAAFCELIAYTGCRISEGLSLTVSRIDAGERAVVFETLKRRKTHVFRYVPIPESLLRKLLALTEVNRDEAGRLWVWSRMTAYRLLKKVMSCAGICGAHAMPKGLRHGFAIVAITQGVPLNLVQRWMGHASLETTSIYAEAYGEEERSIAKKMWKTR